MSAETKAVQTDRTISWRRFITAVSVGCVTAYFIAAFLANFHTENFALIVIGFTSTLLCASIAVALYSQPSAPSRERMTALILLLAVMMSLFVLHLVLKYPGLFERRLILMSQQDLFIFVVFATLAVIFLWIVLQRPAGSRWLQQAATTRAMNFGRKNLDGLFLAGLFFVVYFLFAETINFPSFRTLDLYFDFDISTWISRLTQPVENIPGIRPVHPAILLLLRPPVWFVSLTLNGDRLQALFVVHALAGASCVFMIWLIAKHITDNSAYSLLIAFMLGASASHLLLGSMIETYIYSALALIFFSLLMHKGWTSLRYVLPAGLLAPSITISNIAQTVILYLSTRPSFARALKFTFLSLSLVLILNYAHNRMYPYAGLLLAPSSMDREIGFLHRADLNSWQFRGRTSLAARSVILYGMVAPTPFILDEELGWKGIPHFRTFRIAEGQFQVAGYSGWADLTVKYWFIVLVGSLVLFAVRFIQAPASHLLSTGLLLCLGFNLVLHTLYGDDPILYSPDWVYALVLLIAHGYKPWADRWWLQFILIALLVLMLTVNLGLIHQIMQVSAPLYGK